MKNKLPVLWRARLTLLSALTIVSVLPVAAQDASRAELFAGFSYLNAALASDAKSANAVIFPAPGADTARVSIPGLRGGIAFNLNSHFGIVAESGAHLTARTENTPRPCTQPAPFAYCFRGPESILIYEFLTGLRFSKRGEQVGPFFHMLLGTVGGGAGGRSDSGFAVALGAGLDLKPSDRFAMRFQIEDVRKQIFNRRSNDIQLVFGPVFSWGL